jgi:hypothetical protein
MSQINIQHFNNLNSECLRGLEFYQQELGILQERLDEIGQNNTGLEASEGIEHFQNQFIIHRECIDELKHGLHVNDAVMESELLKTGVFVDEYTGEDHQELYEEYLTEEKIFNGLRHEFNRFAAKWM